MSYKATCGICGWESLPINMDFIGGNAYCRKCSGQAMDDVESQTVCCRGCGEPANENELDGEGCCRFCTC